MRTTLLFLLGAALAAWVGSHYARSAESASAKAEVVSLHLARIEKDSKFLPPAHPARLAAARSDLDSTQMQIAALARDLQEQAPLRLEPLRSTKLQEASAKRAAQSLSPALRPLLEISSTKEPQADGARRTAESLFLYAMLESGIEEIDYLSAREAETDGSVENFDVRSLDIRFRATLAETAQLLSRLATSEGHLPPHRTERIEWRVASLQVQDAKSVYLVDLRVRILLPLPR